LREGVKRTVATAVLMLFLCSILSLSSSRRVAGYAGEYYCCHFIVAVAPESPTTLDEVNISVSILAPYCNHEFNFSSLSQDGNCFSITIETYAPPIGLPLVEYHERVYQIGKLSAGSYVFTWNVLAIDDYWDFNVTYESSCSLPFAIKGYMQLAILSSPLAAVPFTINGQPQSTPYQESLIQDSYVIEMPEAHGDYNWSYWLEDGDSNRIKTIELNTNVTWTAVYEQAEPPLPPSPPIGGLSVPIESHFSSWLAATLLVVALFFVASRGRFRRKNVRVACMQLGL